MLRERTKVYCGTTTRKNQMEGTAGVTVEGYLHLDLIFLDNKKYEISMFIYCI